MRDIAAKPIANSGEEVLKFLSRKVARTSPWSLNGRHYDVELIFVDEAGVNAALYHRPLSRLGAITRRKDYLGEFYVRVGSDETRELVMDQIVCAIDAMSHKDGLAVPRVRRAFEYLRATADALEAQAAEEEAGVAPTP